MTPITISSAAEAQKLAEGGQIVFGAQFIVDPWPSVDAEDQLVTEEMLAERDAIMVVINEAVTAQGGADADDGGRSDDAPGQQNKTADPLADIRGMTAAQIDKRMNKQPMLDLIEEATGTRPASRTKAAELAERLEELANES